MSQEELQEEMQEEVDENFGPLLVAKLQVSLISSNRRVSARLSLQYMKNLSFHSDIYPIRNADAWLAHVIDDRK